MDRRLLVGFAGATVALLLLVYAVGWDEVFAAAGDASLSVYALAFVAAGVCQVFRSLVWSRLLGVVGEEVPHLLVLRIFLTGMFLKYVTPYGQVAAGPGIAYVLAQYTEAEYESDLATVVSADFLNYVPYYSFGGVGFLYFVVQQPQLPDLGLFYVVIPLLVAVIGILLVLFWSRRGVVQRGLVGIAAGTRRLVAQVSTGLADRIGEQAVRDRLAGFYETLDLVSKDRRSVAIAVVYAHVGWFFLMLPVYIVALALGTHIPLGVAFLVVALSKLGFLVPLPGGLGGVELVLAAMITLFVGLSPATATAIAILYRLTAYWQTIALGGLCSASLSVSSQTA